jgi:hypothetical protein
LFHRERLVTNIANLTAEEHAKNLQVHFDDAKRASDFVGIVIRWSFAQFASLYFFSKAFGPEVNWFRGYAYGMCSFVSIGVACYLGGRIALLILLYYSRELTHPQGEVAKMISFVLIVITTTVLWLGTLHLTRDIARATTLLGGS